MDIMKGLENPKNRTSVNKPGFPQPPSFEALPKKFIYITPTGPFQETSWNTLNKDECTERHFQQHDSITDKEELKLLWSVSFWRMMVDIPRSYYASKLKDVAHLVDGARLFGVHT